MKSVLFARVSSKDQEKTGYSLPAQERLLKSYAQNKEIPIAKLFSISESASGRQQRQIFDDMLIYLRKHKIKLIVCEKIDRLTRNMFDAVRINKWMNKDGDRQIHFVKENCILSRDSKSHEKFIWNIKVSVAQFYSDNLSEEVKKGQAEKLAQGWLPNRPPLGYKTIGESGRRTHIPDPEKALFIRKIFELYATGNYSIKRLTRKMEKEGFRNRGDRPLVRSHIARILSDQYYTGKNRWKGEITEGKHKPIISEELFEQVQNILKRKTTPRYSKHNYLFKSSIRCKECGGLITWEKQKGYIYGHCNHYRNCQQKVWTREDRIEKQLLGVFKKMILKSPDLAKWTKKALKESHKEEIEYHNNSQSELKSQYDKVQQRLDRLYDDRLDNNVDEDFYKRKFRQYSEEKSQVLKQMKNNSKANTKYFQGSIKIFEVSQNAHKLFEEELLIDEKRRIIRMLFDNLYLDEGKLSYQFSMSVQVLSKAIAYSNSSKVLDLAKTKPQIFELAKYGFNKAKNRVSDPVCSKWLPG